MQDSTILTDNDYSKILLEGYFLHSDFLPNYYFKKYKEAEKNFTSFSEFYQRLSRAWHTLYNAAEVKYNEYLVERYYPLLDKREAEGRDTSDIHQRPWVEWPVRLPRFMVGTLLCVQDLYNIKGAIDAFSQLCSANLKDINQQPITGDLEKAKPGKDKKAKKNKKIFLDFLLHQKKDQLAEKLKDEFSVEVGVKIRMLIEVLRAWQPEPLVSIGNREMKSFIEAMGTHFSRDIGEYQSINDFNKFNQSAYKKDMASIQTRVQFVLKSL